MKALRNDKGFAIAPILLAIALIGIIAGAIAVSNRSATLSTAEYSTRAMASTIIQQLYNLQTGYAIMLARGLHPNEIKWGAADDKSIFNPISGGTSEQIPPAEAADSGVSKFEYVYKFDTYNLRPVVTIQGIGLDNSADYVVVLPGVKKAVCEQVNKLLYGSSANWLDTISIKSYNDWNNPSEAIPINNISGSNLYKKTIACIKTTDNRYVIFAVLKEQ